MIANTSDCSKQKDFSDLIVNLDCFKSTYNYSSDSDDPFGDLEKGMKNITFSRSKTYFDHDFELFPHTPSRSDETNKENPQSILKHCSSSNKKMNKSKTNPKHSVLSKSPLRSCNSILVNTPKTKKLSILGCVSSKQAYKETNPMFETPVYRTTSSPVFNLTPVTPSNSCVSKSSGQHSKNLMYTPTLNLNSESNKNNHTPFNKVIYPKLSASKELSLKKAAITARKDVKDMWQTVRLRKSILKQNNVSPCVITSSCKSKCGLSCKCCMKLASSPVRKKCFNENSTCNIINTTVCNKEKSSANETDDSKKNDDFDDDDLPCTQLMSAVILRGVVAYVEVRSGRECYSLGTKAELQSLGAKVENNFTRKVTHCFFHGGRMSTYKKAIEWKVPLVSTLWIEACKAELRMVPIKGHEPYGIEKYKEALPLYKLKFRTRRPVTDSKINNKRWKQHDMDKYTASVVNTNQQVSSQSTKDSKMIEALHSVAGDFKKATNKFEEILKSPILKNRSKQSTIKKSKKAGPEETNGNLPTCKTRRNKKLVFVSSSEDECNKEKLEDCNNTNNNSLVKDNSNDTVEEIRVSYDSDDLLVYAKKQAASARCSAPARLLTNRKCKKLLSSCQKMPSSAQNKEIEFTVPDSRKIVENVQVIHHPEGTSSKTNIEESSKKKLTSMKKGVNIVNEETKGKPRKRKLLLPPSQVVTTFRQDSEESASELSPLCPYTDSPIKKKKLDSENKNEKRLMIPNISSDCESDDSITRAARRESSALFVKKQKKLNTLRSTPTIVCTSLKRSDTEVVSSIVSRLGKFTVEPNVSEHTTHVVTCTPRRTINLLKGIARGCWILNVQWIFQSLEAGKWLHEERFELTEFSPSVQQARVERQAFGPEFSLELFKGLGLIYVCRATIPPSSDLIELIRLCGGIVVSSAKAASIVIGSSTPFSPTGRQPLMVKEKWVLDCITKLTQLSPHDYISV